MPYDAQRTISFGLALYIDSLRDSVEDLGLVRPFVVVHAVRRDTGRYLRQPKTSPYYPLSTSPCRLKHATATPDWREVLLLDLPFSVVVHPQTLLIFEVLDMYDSSSLRLDDNRSASMQFPRRRVAWAFLLPVGGSVEHGLTMNVGIPPRWLRTKPSEMSKLKGKQSTSGPTTEPNKSRAEVNSGDIPSDQYSSFDCPLRLQLYHYRKEGYLTRWQRREMCGWSGGLLNIEEPEQKRGVGAAHPDGIPAVYWQWRRKTLKPLMGVLHIKAGCRARSRRDEGVYPGDRPMSGVKSKSYREITSLDKDGRSAAVRTSVLERSRASSEPCVPPNRLLHRLHVGPEGAMVVAFSHCGSFLAVAAPSIPITAPLSGSSHTSPHTGCMYALKIFDPDIGVELFSDPVAHHGVIYEIKWSLLDTFLVTCSGDGRCKVWEVSVQVSGVSYLEKRPGTVSSPTSPYARPTSSPSSPTRIESGMTPLPPGTPYLLRCLRTDIGNLKCTLLAELSHSPPVFIYSAIFQEYSSSKGLLQADRKCPRVISGASDGRIRMWNGAQLEGECTTGKAQYRPHEGAVNSIVIDDRSRYMISADAIGCILVWRTDGYGYYQLLRKFKKDDISFLRLAITSLAVHPDSSRSQLLVLAPPHTLRLYSSSNHRIQANFPGISLTGTFTRAYFSADGGLIACGSTDSNGNKIKFWDSQSGDTVLSRLSEVVLPFSVRSLSWHPKQHMVAVAMLGSNASLLLYVAEKESIRCTAARKAASKKLPLNSNTEDNLLAEEREREKMRERKREMMEMTHNPMMSNVSYSLITEGNSTISEGGISAEKEANRREMREKKSQEILTRIQTLKSLHTPYTGSNISDERERESERERK